jgi:hypothetical protein
VATAQGHGGVDRGVLRYLIGRYILSELGDLRLRDIHSTTVREWITRLTQVHGARPPTIRNVKVIFDAVLTTALTDHVVPVHPGRGVRTPPVARKPRRIITAEQFQALYDAIPDDVMRLLVETDIESGLRSGLFREGWTRAQGGQPSRPARAAP